MTGQGKSSGLGDSTALAPRQPISCAFRKRVGKFRNGFIAKAGDHEVWRDRYNLIVRHPRPTNGKKPCYRNPNRETYVVDPENVVRYELIKCCGVRLSPMEQQALIQQVSTSHA